MLYVTIFDAKEDVSLKKINEEREEWYKKGRDHEFRKLCKRVERFEVVGKTPMRIIFVIETDDPSALNIISGHFGKRWKCTTYPVLQREIEQAMKQDTTIIAG